MFVEQRVAPRELLVLPLKMGEHPAVTRDISASGLYLEMGGCHDLGGSVVFEMDLPDANLRFCADGEIVRIEHTNGKTGVAVRLLSTRLHPLP